MVGLSRRPSLEAPPSALAFACQTLLGLGRIRLAMIHQTSVGHATLPTGLDWSLLSLKDEHD